MDGVPPAAFPELTDTFRCVVPPASGAACTVVLQASPFYDFMAVGALDEFTGVDEFAFEFREPSRGESASYSGLPVATGGGGRDVHPAPRWYARAWKESSSTIASSR